MEEKKCKFQDFRSVQSEVFKLSEKNSEYRNKIYKSLKKSTAEKASEIMKILRENRNCRTKNTKIKIEN